ncbi:class F sortase [Streptomyces sp. TLI_171]|uniref:class F sortase n=1 Tax=Streptomyces sp. TLI_171 TaxID=1938859 RepID=UPI000C1984AF|nr:class F sortase [Streptomyces sp. TLI_171]
MPGRSRQRRGRRPRWAPAAAAALLAAGGVTLVAAGGSDPAPVRIAATGQGPATAPAATAPPPTTPQVRFSLPVRLVIPRIDVDAPVQGVGLNPDGTVEVPSLDRPEQVGWYRNGPAPGRLGPAVLLGHYDTRKGPAVFHRLPSLRPGDRIDIRREDGSTLSYQVRELRQFAKDAFPTDLVYGDTAGPQLRLITCGGTLAGNGHYTDNIIVFADPAP